MPLTSEIDDLGSEIVTGREKRETNIKRQQAILKLFDTLGSNLVVSNSKATVGVFDLLREHSQRVGRLTQSVQLRREYLSLKFSFAKLRQYRRYKKLKKRKQWKADKFNEMRV